MNTVKIINPAAGKGKAVKEINDNTRYYVSKSVGDVEKYVYDTLLIEPETHFIICGGDGSINEAVNGIMRANASDTAMLSAVADGTGNDFLRYEHNKNETVKCDIVKYNDRYFMNILNIGFDCTVVSKTNDYKKKPLINGSFAYLCGVVNTLTKNFGIKLDVMTVGSDGKTESFSDDFMLCVAANARYYGGGFKPAPLADITDGLIDLVLVKKVPRARIPSIIGLYKKGQHIDPVTGDIIDKFKDIMIYRKCTSIRVSGMKDICADGEIEPCDDVNISIVPKKIRFMF